MKPTNEQIIEAATSSYTMAEAAAKIGIHVGTFKRRAILLGVYAPNQGAKGSSKPRLHDPKKLELDDILVGKHPQYQAYKLKHRLFKEGLKTNQCEVCLLTDWLGEPIACELDHINGDSKDHRLNNLRVLCPNCHSQTDTFRARNIGRILH